ncbi:hypothetical protein HYC85_001539 [Camellia sinensis]|uniref:Eukaryotic translation initiation factor 3 subunit J n=1 Tax=Camellia sinensis TaxID=4442 RepID=A0A7J7I5P0_CAMSI|nr:hypothetical protein HYC85_001539 [Camellia sinensis]
MGGCMTSGGRGAGPCPFFALFRIRIRTQAIRRVHENIDKTLKAAEVILSQFDLSRRDEAIPPLVKKELPKSSWEDEDADDNDVKDSWEDEDEPAPAPAPAPLPQPPAEKVVKKTSAKTSEKKGKTVEVATEVPLDPAAEKLRQERLVEEADFKSTRDLFGSRDDGKTLDNFIPKSESDFLEYAELISHKLRPYEKSFHYIGLLKDVMRLSMTALKAADAKEVASSVTAIANEKIKAEKEANAGKKKTGAKKKQLHVDKPDDEAVVDAYDAYDDYDFM